MDILDQFNGHKKVGKWFFEPLEKRMKAYLVPRMPKCIETHHLTMMTLVWCAGILLGGYLASNYSMHWMWLVSVMIALQWFTDVLDGAVGRYRDTGLLRWGYYMDHFLDYVFVSCILISYAFILPPRFDYSLFFILVIIGGFLVSTYLDYGARKQFRFSFLGIGPSEVRLIFIIINTLLIIYGKTGMASALPYALGAALFGLIYVVYKTQKELWKFDMDRKHKKDRQ